MSCAAYLDAAIEQHIAAGMNPAQAARAARAEIGSLEAIKDYTRDAGWESTLDTMSRDVRYALAHAAQVARLLRRRDCDPGARHRRHHGDLQRRQRRPAARAAGRAAAGADLAGRCQRPWHGCRVLVRRLPSVLPMEGASVADAIAASSSNRTAITIGGQPEPVMHKRVSGNYFTTLGVGAAAGRTLLASRRSTAGRRAGGRHQRSVLGTPVRHGTLRSSAAVSA